MPFEALGLSKPLITAVHAKGYITPTPIQTEVIPPALRGLDIMASAQTGTGKTAGFTLPLLQRLNEKARAKSTHALALVLTPTRELAAQVHQSVLDYGKLLKLRSAVVFGGVNIGPQIRQLSHGAEIVVATPGRLLDLYQQKAINLSQIEILVLDEADRMLDMGFIHDIKKILNLLPKKRQNLLFSATFSNEIRTLAKGLLHNPVEISVAARNSTVTAIEQVVHCVEQPHKAQLLSHLIREGAWQQALVFSRTKHGANKLVKLLALDNIHAAALHGNKSQSQRTKALQDFKNGAVKILVATDIAARGLDIEQLPQIVNFDLPNVPEDYVHRIGRTGRAGATGHAISFVSMEETRLLRDIERLIKQTIKREKVEGFQPKTQPIAPAKPLVTKNNSLKPARNSPRPSGSRPPHSYNSKRNTGNRTEKGS
ncbi:MAG: DEAD/DEAH box helicase [Legionellales bacterium]|nr:DEAD/DEAH box helicase [Legionellales bacterium]